MHLGDPRAVPEARSFAAKFGHLAPRTSAEFERVLSLARRPVVDLSSPRAEALVKLITARLSNGATSCECPSGRCLKELRPIQAWALYEAPLAGGLLAPIGVGHGKTLLDLLAPMVFDGVKTAVLLIPPSLKNQLLRDYQAASAHFRVPSLVVDGGGKIIPGRPVLHVVPYSLFSRAGSTSLLSQIGPDLIIADEAHKLKNKQTATASRVFRYLSQNPKTRFCAWSGTVTQKSIRDYATLAAFALDEGSPLPRTYQAVEEWAGALDAVPDPAPPGVLERFCEGKETVREGFHRRLASTFGVVSTKENSSDATIFLHARSLPVPAEITQAIKQLEKTWTRADGEELTDALEVEANKKQLSCGFFYRWKFPRGEPENLILEWFGARKSWHKELRDKLQDRREGLDSPLLCTQAATRAMQGYKGVLPTWDSKHLARWLELKDQVQPESEAVWISEFLAQDAASWALKNRGVVWYEFDTFGERVSRLSKLPKYGGGPLVDGLLTQETGERSVILSIKAHGTGRDGLQRIFSRQLVANTPSSGVTWEQLLGRLARPGQGADEIETHLYEHTETMRSAYEKAEREAEYIEQTLGTPQRLLQVVRA